MKLGVAIFLTDEGLPPDELAPLVESRGFESLFVPEHTHIPASRDSHFRPEGGELEREYSRTLDPFVALSFAAAATDRLLLGTGICLIAQRDPITTAKQVASLDHSSGGRFMLGIGAGWNREEMHNHGTDPRQRFAIMREHVESMRAIWKQDEASYDGDYVEFDRIWAWPKPWQQSGPPVLIGGNGPTVVDRVLRYGDGWLPEPEPDLPDRIDELHRRASELGREVTVTVYGVEPDQVRDFDRAGADRCVFWLPPAPADAVRVALDQVAIAAGTG